MLAPDTTSSRPGGQMIYRLTTWLQLQGGANGSVRLIPELDYPTNKGLAVALSLLDPLLQRFDMVDLSPTHCSLQSKILNSKFAELCLGCGGVLRFPLTCVWAPGVGS